MSYIRCIDYDAKTLLANCMLECVSLFLKNVFTFNNIFFYIYMFVLFYIILV